MLAVIWKTLGFITRAAVALATAAVASVLLAALGALAAPRLLGLQPTIVLSGSMEPALATGGLAFVRPLEAAPDIEGGSTDATAGIRKGDVITFRAPRSPDRQVSHRVIGVIEDLDGRRFATQGDANPEPDPVLVPADNVVGTVVYHVPQLGRFAQALRQPAAFIALTGTPTLLVLMVESRSLVREARVRRRPTRDELHRALRELARA